MGPSLAHLALALLGISGRGKLQADCLPPRRSGHPESDNFAVLVPPKPKGREHLACLRPSFCLPSLVVPSLGTAGRFTLPSGPRQPEADNISVLVLPPPKGRVVHGPICPTLLLTFLGSQAWGLCTGPLALMGQAIQNLPKSLC